MEEQKALRTAEALEKGSHNLNFPMFSSEQYKPKNQTHTGVKNCNSFSHPGVVLNPPSREHHSKLHTKRGQTKKKNSEPRPPHVSEIGDLPTQPARSEHQEPIRGHRRPEGPLSRCCGDNTGTAHRIDWLTAFESSRIARFIMDVEKQVDRFTIGNIYII